VREIGSGIIAMKFISLIAYIGTAVLFGWYAQQDDPRHKVNGATAAAFFALNPFILMQAIGNGHNDMFALFFMAVGLVLWQREKWAWAALLFIVSTLVKLTGLIVLPLFGIAVLVNAPNWRARILRGLGIAAIFITATLILYGMVGPFPEVFSGVKKALFGRQGYSPAYAVLVLSWDLFPSLGRYILPTFRYIFVIYYIYLLVALAQKRLTFIQAGFMAYFIQLMCISVFRIWYPMWLLPFAALGLNSRAYWRTFLFSLTVEFSILSYFVLWRWVLKYVEWGPYLFGTSWEYWRVMTLFTVPWTFGLPFFGGLFAEKDKSFDGKLSSRQ
jgi:Gpi18-like mannosyltransferase